ncbi:MAG: glutamate racemase [Actinobacteria bacterium]|nr:glutamate racemase [Actinomycetota bacterium]
MGDPRPIGIFDSGVGGLTVARAVLEDLPREPIVYVGDTARCPYGPRPLEEIRRFGLEIAAYLLSRDVKALVVACNAITVAAFDDIVRLADGVPVVGVIEPGVRAAVGATRNRRIGLIGTVATVDSGVYQRTLERAVAGGPARVELLSRPCPLFVEFVERGDTASPELLEIAEGYLAPLREAGVDTLILGCTHYPLLRGLIAHVMGREVTLVSSAEETAKDVYEVLLSNGLLQEELEPPAHEFLCTGEPEQFERVAVPFLGPALTDVRPARAVPVGRIASWS